MTVKCDTEICIRSNQRPMCQLVFRPGDFKYRDKTSRVGQIYTTPGHSPVLDLMLRVSFLNDLDPY